MLLAAVAAPAGALGAALPVRGDGKTELSGALADAAANGPVTLAAGRYRIARDMRFQHGLRLEPGAVLVVDRANLKIEGFFEASRLRAFECLGSGRVRFDAGAVIEAYPEWWGAEPGRPDVDCLPALSACIEAAEITRLAAADYHISDTLKLHVAHRHLQGAGWFGTSSGDATRLVLTGAKAGTASVLQVGPDTAPSSANAFDQSIGVADLILARTAACVPPPGGDERLAACGMVIRHVLFCRVDRVSVLESSVGFYIHDTIYTKLTDCFTQRYQPGTHADGDVMRGFYLDGRQKGIFSGGNASLYLDRCNVTGSHSSHSNPIAFRASGAFCDIYIDRFETSNVPKGCVLDADDTPNPENGNINCRIRGATFDWCSAIGIEIRSAPGGMVATFSDIYVSLAPGALAGMLIHDGGGQVSIVGGEIHAGASKGSLWIARQTEVAVQGLRIRDSVRPVLLEAARGCDLQLSINNPTKRADQAALVMTDCTRTYLRPFIIGRDGAFPLGVDLRGTGNRRNEINCTGIDPAALADKNPAGTLRHNDANVTGRGEFGEGNLASGAMG
jgi:hypothetical protein